MKERFIFDNKITNMNWKILANTDQIDEIKVASKHKMQIIFKHSTRCIISKMALKRFEDEFNLEGQIDLYYLDLIKYRDISNRIADDFEIIHQSPQILLIKDGKVIYNESHEGIDAGVLHEFV